MGFFDKMLKEAEKAFTPPGASASASSAGASVEAPKFDPDNPPTRWEKAVVGLNGIVQQVSKIDPDGIDVFCVPGGYNEVDVYRNVRDTSGLEQMVTARQPSGPCHMGRAIDMVFNEAFARGFARPCCILVLTAGRPDDHEQLAGNLARAAQSVQKPSDVTVTFVQVGDDEWAEGYLKHLDDNLTCVSATGETIDIVDTIKDEEIKQAVGEIKQEGMMQSGGAGALFGAFAGAALGAGGMYLYNQVNAKKRTEGWNGTWKALNGDQELATLSVTDDLQGNLAITEPNSGVTSEGHYAESEDGYNIMIQQPTGIKLYGTVEDEHNIYWSDGTRWEEVPPDGGSWVHYAGAAAAGAAASGAAGYLIQKKFFNNAANKVACDYVIVMDRSQMMAVPDTGK